MVDRRCMVTFAIPLVGRLAARDWDEVEALLNRTLAGIYRQSDPNFRVLVAGPDRPRIAIADDDRLEFVPATANVEPGLQDRRHDIRRKRRLLAQHHVAGGGGYLVFVDSDDLVSRRLVEHVRHDRHPWGYVGRRGYLYDAAGGLIADQSVLSADGEPIFDQWCGTCTVLHLGSRDLPASGAAPTFFDDLTSVDHGSYSNVCRTHGRPLAPLPFPIAVYVLNTGQNLSETSGSQERTEVFRRLLGNIAGSATPPTPDLIEEFFLPAGEFSKPSAAVRAPTKRLSVAICAYKRPSSLARLLDALMPQIDDRADREVVVVNDGTHDDAYEAIVAAHGERIRYHATERRGGLPAARNRAAALAEGEFVVQIDDDCVPPPWWLDWLEAAFDADPDLDAVAGTTRPLLPAEPSFVARLNIHFALQPQPWRAGDDLMMVGANMAVRRSLYWRIGGHRVKPGWAGAGEDAELSRRLVLANARTRLDPDWFVYHETEDGIANQMRRFARYGYADPWLGRLPSGPIGLDRPGRETWRARAASFARIFKANRARAAGFAGTPLERFAAALAASLIIASTDAGYARAVREQRRGATVPRLS